jgi:hypothetical protein
MEQTIYLYMQTRHLSVCQTKLPEVAQSTKSTQNNITKLKVFLSKNKGK